MCLYATGTFKVAQEDIKCYKVLDSDNQSIHYAFDYTPNTNYKLNSNLTLRPSRSCSEIKDFTGIVREGYHSFISKLAADSWAPFAPERKIVEVFIPKGASYIEGINGDGDPCYVSTELRTGDLQPLERT